MDKAITEQLLRLLADRGEMKAQEFLASVPRTRGDYLDFYPVAALLHAGYISTDSTFDSGDKKVEGKLGLNTKDTAVFLCQLMLKPGESFQIDDCPRESAHDFPLKVFITSDGYLRLDELAERKAERVRKRIDYLAALAVAIVAALVSSYLTHHFASERQRAERAKQDPVPTQVPVGPNKPMQRTRSGGLRPPTRAADGRR